MPSKHPLTHPAEMAVNCCFHLWTLFLRHLSQILYRDYFHQTHAQFEYGFLLMTDNHADCQNGNCPSDCNCGHSYLKKKKKKKKISSC